MTTLNLTKVPADAPAQETLEKGVNINLSKAAPGLNELQIGLGWNPAVSPGTKFDLDAIALLLDKNSKATQAVFYNNKNSAEGSVVHSGDNLTGQGDGDDETLLVTISKIPADIEKVLFVVNIHEAKERSQNFGQVQSAYIRAIDNATGTVLGKYNLSEDYSAKTGVTFAELYRNPDNTSEWKFRAVGAGLTGNLTDIFSSYGL